MPHALLMDNDKQQPLTPKLFADPAFLAETAGLWVALSLNRGGGAILETTPETWRHAQAKLEELGLDPRPLQAEGRLVVLDAHKVDKQVNSDGGPHPETFMSIVQQTAGQIRAKIQDAPLNVWSESTHLLADRQGPWMARFAQSLWKEAASAHDLAVIGPDPITDTLDNDMSDDLGDDLDDVFDEPETGGWCEYVSTSVSSNGHEP